jgi:uncharacterized low-complexity protein
MNRHKNILNNMVMDNKRRDPLYQTIITDLALAGCIRLEAAEMLLGYKIPSYLKAPDGTTVATLSEKNKVAGTLAKKLKSIVGKTADDKSDEGKTADDKSDEGKTADDKSDEGKAADKSDGSTN